ncbi:MAG: hypothetical protein GVY20_03115 [Bacteroidetes bacterium]|jgi:hypothetical protein|nr:hypothetical protein [Bacteroidota bacterium]
MITYNRIFFFVILIVFTEVISCKDNSTNVNTPSLEITNVTYSLFALNSDGCDFGSDGVGSAFLIEIDFDASSNIEIDGIEYDLNFVDRAEFPNTFVDDFDLTNEGLEFIRCFLFEETEGVELAELKILANDESVESNEVNISIDRPEGANKEAD